MTRPVVLITGCSTGIGRASVEALRGHATVIATARRLGDIEDLAGDGVEIDVLDVADDASRRGCVERTLAQHGRLDALVNNAGYGAFLPVEETDEAAMQAMYDVNVFGLHALTRLVLPAMRAQGHGRIVNVASIVGHISFPFIGAYSSTKFAVRSLTTALDSEVRAHGIRAILIEPGRIATRFSHRGRAETRLADDSAYRVQAERYVRRMFHDGGAKPEAIARRIRRACLSRRPRIRYLAPWDAKSLHLATRVLPDGVFRWTARRIIGRPPKNGGS